MKYRQRVKKGMTKNIKRIDIRKIKSEYLSPITNLDDISIGIDIDFDFDIYDDLLDIDLDYFDLNIDIK